MADFGFKTSAPNVDVKTALPRDLVVSSTRNTLKVGDVVHTTITTDGGGTATLVINHGLTFVPVFFIAVNFGGSYYFEPFNGLSVVDLLFYATVTLSTITITLDSLSNPNSTYDLYYWLSETEQVV